VLSGDKYAQLSVDTKGVRFESLHFLHGVTIREGCSVTMEKCVFDGIGHWLYCNGKVQAARCTFEGNGTHGVIVNSEDGSAGLVDCVMRNNSENGLQVGQGTALLRGGSILGNKHNGVHAWYGGRVTVAEAEEDGLPQTVSEGNERQDWNSIGPFASPSRIIGIPEEKTGHDRGY